MVFPNHIEALEPKYPTLRELIENDMIDLSEMSYAEPYGLDDQVAGVLTIYSSTYMDHSKKLSEDKIIWNKIFIFKSILFNRNMAFFYNWI